MHSIVKYFKKLIGKSKKQADNVNLLPEGVQITQFVHPIIGSCSQYNEDLIIDALLKCKKIGTYIDIGANDPSVLSNTERFYNRGWSGINIEPDTRLHEKLVKLRSRDVNLNIGVGPISGNMTFYIMSADTLSSFNKEAALEGGRIHGAKLISTQQVIVKPLVNILDEYLPNKEIDFMSVDAEGFDLDVLKSNDWFRYRPFLLIVEINQGGKEIITYLGNNNYMLIYSNCTNGIFIDLNSSKKEMIV